MREQTYSRDGGDGTIHVWYIRRLWELSKDLPVIDVPLKDIAEREGIDNPYMLSEKTGLPYETCRRVWNDASKHIGLGTIERLCDVLQVRPGQLFDYEYEPDKTETPKGKRKV